MEGRLRGRLQREREFHDALARELDVSDLPPRPLDPVEREMASGLSFDGLRILDLGCGRGDMTLWLANQGADVTAIDLSPEMVTLANERIARYAAGRARAVSGPVESLPFEDAEFDLVFGKWILHHLELGAAAPEIARVLRPGGRGVFGETSASNPLLMLARRSLPGRFGIPRLGTEDERPIDSRAMALLRQSFGEVDASYRPFLFLGALGRQIQHSKWAWLTRVTEAADSGLARVPALGRLSYYMVLTLRP